MKALILKAEITEQEYYGEVVKSPECPVHPGRTCSTEGDNPVACQRFLCWFKNIYSGGPFVVCETRKEVGKMRCSINLQSDPISLNIIAADGKEHQHLDAIGNGEFVDIILVGEQMPALDKAGAV